MSPKSLGQFLLYVSWYIAGYGVLFYAARFTVIQSLVLDVIGVAAVIGYHRGSTLATKQESRPFRVSIQPNWSAICRDFEFEGSRRLTEIEGLKPGYNVLRDGLKFTVLNPRLLYWNDYDVFLDDFDFRIWLPELGTTFYLNRTRRGKTSALEFGITESLHGSLEGEKNIPIAWLPDFVFVAYKYPNLSDRQLLKIERTTKDLLATFDWNYGGRWRWWNTRIEHKYFCVECLDLC